MEKEIQSYLDAEAEFIKTIEKLDAVVSQAMKTCHTVDQLMELADQLPRTYKGARRIYEQVERLMAGNHRC